MMQESLDPIDDIWDIADSIVYGHVLDQLKRLPDKCVNLVVTSPPYYGKMWYKTEPVIWDDDPNCNHKWDKGKRVLRYGKSKASTIRHKGTDKHAETQVELEYALCSWCGAFKGELGQELDYRDFVRHLYQVFMEVKRVLKDDGQFWLNMGDSYAGSGGWGKHILHPDRGTIDTSTKRDRFPTILTGQDYQDKCLMMIPTRLVEQMIDDGGWILRNMNIWHIPNKKPSSAQDRLSNKYEFLFLLTKKKHYTSYLDAIKIPSETYIEDKRSQVGKRIIYDGKSKKTSTYLPSQQYANPGDVWTFPSATLSLGHFASFPESLIERTILFGSKKGDIVFDPFIGSGTVAIVSKKLQRHYVGIELNPEYIEIAKQRFAMKGNLQVMHGKNVKQLFRRKKKQ